MTVRGKFKVTELTTGLYLNGATLVKLEAVYSGSAEDNTYARATPSGTITIVVSNPEAIASFIPTGKSFYVDFTPIEEPAAG